MHPFDELNEADIVLDKLPDDVVSSIEVRNRLMNDIGVNGDLGLEFLVADLQRWVPGQVVRVAFLDGDSHLHANIAAATQEISDACNLTLDFGNDGNGNFRRWSENDNEYSADIRVSFDKNGYFSLVGTDSVNRNIGSPFGRIGGRPGQCSLNLGGFQNRLPSTWQGTTRHEFLHALGFHHSHQNMRGPCQESFRWDDDEGYLQTRDANGRFITDVNGKRPGIYTYLAGFPNFWDRQKVDHNLKTEEDPNLVAGPFDRSSVMLYRFPKIFYKSLPSPCAPLGDGQSLSDGDKRGLRLLYPDTAAEVSAVTGTQLNIVSGMASAEDLRFEAAHTSQGAQLSVAASILRNNLKSVE